MNLTNYDDTIRAAEAMRAAGAGREGLAIGEDPNARTFQQQMIMDAVEKTLGRKKKT